MHYLRLIGLWGAALFALNLSATTIAPFGIMTGDPRLDDSTIYPTYRFYRGGAYASVTESTLSQVFRDRLSGAGDDALLSNRLGRHLYRLCLKHGMDPAFVLSVLQAESGFRADAVSPAGAVGLMQLMPATAQVVGRRRYSSTALRDPFLNLDLGVAYLRQLQDRYSGLSPYYVLAAYNIGPSRLDQLRVNPGFRPDKTLRYFKEIMRGVGDWRRYGSQALHEVSTIPPKRSALKMKSDAEFRIPVKRTDAA